VSIHGVGVDIVSKERIRKIHQKYGIRFAERLFAGQELKEYHRAGDKDSFLAKRFAAKEAISKVLGTGITSSIHLRDLILTHDERGKPLVVLEGPAREQMHALGMDAILISITDEKEHAIAFCVGANNGRSTSFP
jgi:holo-[acyl-carrier protein] synthase